MYDNINLINLNNNNEEKKEGTKKMKKTYRLTTNKSNLVKFAKIQFMGMILLCLAIIITAIIIGNNKTTTQIVTKEVKVIDQNAVDAAAQEKFEQYKAEYQPEVVTVTETVEVEKIIEVEKPITITETVEVPVEVIKTVEIEKPVTVVETVEVEKPIYVETVKTVKVVDQAAVQQLATEMAVNMYNAYKEAYTAQVDSEATESAIAAKTAELEAEYTQLMSDYMAEADAAKVVELATTMAAEMFEQYKAEYVVEYTEAQEAARVATTSFITIQVITPKGEVLKIKIQGSLHDELTWTIIYNTLQKDNRIDFTNWKIKRVDYQNAVETFVGRDFQSVRVIHFQYK